jgi:hypothetical protein
MPKSFTPCGSNSSTIRGEQQEVYLTFSPRFRRIWIQAEKRMPNHVAQNSTTGMRSKYALCLYGWAKKHLSARTKRITVEEVRKLFGLESVKDANGKIIREGPLSLWGNFRQRALKAIAESIRRPACAVAGLRRYRKRRDHNVGRLE